MGAVVTLFRVSLPRKLTTQEAGRSPRRRGFLVTRVALPLLVVLLWTLAAPRDHASAEARRTWADLVQSLSEPAGYFDSDNFISNETSYETVLTRLSELKLQGGVYIGVGPDQNFTYLTRLRPEQAIIIDIRRQNMLQHLLYKALMERARSRLEYLSLLFSRPVKLP